MHADGFIDRISSSQHTAVFLDWALPRSPPTLSLQHPGNKQKQQSPASSPKMLHPSSDINNLVLYAAVAGGRMRSPGADSCLPLHFIFQGGNKQPGRHLSITHTHTQASPPLKLHAFAKTEKAAAHRGKGGGSYIGLARGLPVPAVGPGPASGVVLQFLSCGRQVHKGSCGSRLCVRRQPAPSLSILCGGRA